MNRFRVRNKNDVPRSRFQGPGSGVPGSPVRWFSVRLGLAGRLCPRRRAGRGLKGDFNAVDAVEPRSQGHAVNGDRVAGSVRIARRASGSSVFCDLGSPAISALNGSRFLVPGSCSVNREVRTEQGPWNMEPWNMNFTVLPTRRHSYIVQSTRHVFPEDTQ
jgi:hypothetical protein